MNNNKEDDEPFVRREDLHRKKKKKRTIGDILFYAVPILALTVVISCGTMFIRDFLEYKAGEDAYNTIEEKYIMVYTDDGSSDNASGGKTDGGSGAGEAAGETWEYPALDIDFAGLTALNPDFAGVIVIPSLNITYPMVYSEDNVDYLHVTFDKQSNSAGSIFYDALSPHDFLSKNTFIFGHNMKNGTMFGKLKWFLSKPELCAANPYIYIYTEDKVRRYEIFSYYKTQEDSKTYEDFEGEDGYDDYVAMCMKLSQFSAYADDIDFTKRPDLLTLSTCSGPAGGSTRFPVHAALTGVQRYQA